MKTAEQLGVVACPLCDLVMRKPDVAASCPRCGEWLPIHSRRGLTKCWALVIAAAALYFPANALPMMNTEQFPLRRSDTIFSGITFLWREGSWELAALVFAASILVPVTKLLALGFLLVTSSRRSTWRPRVRTKLYRALEVVGHWSMLDVFVVSLLTAVVQLGRFASVEPGPAVLPFASVVVLTMLASASFDPRTIWAGRER
ncbi:MAG TPA: paraquat-inducible protein A [Kofleriaceae bacterium]|nr:paraquat-inducible protein A [Kofleriaceae bacterium]